MTLFPALGRKLSRQHRALVGMLHERRAPHHQRRQIVRSRNEADPHQFANHLDRRWLVDQHGRTVTHDLRRCDKPDDVAALSRSDLTDNLVRTINAANKDILGHDPDNLDIAAAVGEVIQPAFFDDARHITANEHRPFGQQTDFHEPTPPTRLGESSGAETGNGVHSLTLVNEASRRRLSHGGMA